MITRGRYRNRITWLQRSAVDVTPEGDVAQDFTETKVWARVRDIPQSERELGDARFARAELEVCTPYHGITEADRFRVGDDTYEILTVSEPQTEWGQHRQQMMVLARAS